MHHRKMPTACTLKVFQRIAESPAVSIASIQVLPSPEDSNWLLACDLRVAGPNAEFALPEVRLGLIPSAGGCTRLPALIGASRARSVILGGEPIPKALEWGVIATTGGGPPGQCSRLGSRHRNTRSPRLSAWPKVLRGGIEDRLELERLAQTVLYDRKEIRLLSKNFRPNNTRNGHARLDGQGPPRCPDRESSHPRFEPPCKAAS